MRVETRAAVSPIVATLIMIVIAVAAAAIVYVFVGGSSGNSSRSTTTKQTMTTITGVTETSNAPVPQNLEVFASFRGIVHSPSCCYNAYGKFTGYDNSPADISPYIQLPYSGDGYAYFGSGTADPSIVKLNAHLQLLGYTVDLPSINSLEIKVLTPHDAVVANKVLLTPISFKGTYKFGSAVLNYSVSVAAGEHVFEYYGRTADCGLPSEDTLSPVFGYSQCLWVGASVDTPIRIQIQQKGIGGAGPGDMGDVIIGPGHSSIPIAFATPKANATAAYQSVGFDINALTNNQQGQFSVFVLTPQQLAAYRANGTISNDSPFLQSGTKVTCWNEPALDSGPCVGLESFGAEYDLFFANYGSSPISISYQFDLWITTGWVGS